MKKRLSNSPNSTDRKQGDKNNSAASFHRKGWLSKDKNKCLEGGTRAGNHPFLSGLEALIKELCLEFTWLEF